MPTLDDVRRAAARLPGSEERRTAGGAAWFVRGRLFARGWRTQAPKYLVREVGSA